ncbi:hypothetical protein LIER_18674 [Lithospermum erythrorhizon]|uniref:Uncharacterized protein n=1 Tax=Lithospermum erythrorhizon TaxID=34254 RepID=A0AAV3QF29_LITER
MYYPHANGLEEAFKKTLCDIMKKVVNKSKEELAREDRRGIVGIPNNKQNAETSHHVCISLPFVYGVEAVFPLEVQISSLRVVVNEGFIQEEALQLRLQELDSLDEQRLQAPQRL